MIAHSKAKLKSNVDKTSPVSDHSEQEIDQDSFLSM
jgi:hypothetical protein